MTTCSQDKSWGAHSRGGGRGGLGVVQECEGKSEEGEREGASAQE